MLDFSFGEIGLIAVVALLALGPERLPKVARTAGVLVRRARSTWQNVRNEVEAEFASGDLMHGTGAAQQIAADLRREIATSTVGAMPSSSLDGATTTTAGSNPTGENNPGRSIDVGTAGPWRAQQSGRP